MSDYIPASNEKFLDWAKNLLAAPSCPRTDALAHYPHTRPVTTPSPRTTTAATAHSTAPARTFSHLSTTNRHMGTKPRVSAGTLTEGGIGK
jgi:hypothetical protein